jgi:hypothetical protein
MNVSVLPQYFDFREHILLWKRYRDRDELIPWNVAREYFRKRCDTLPRGSGECDRSTETNT